MRVGRIAATIALAATSWVGAATLAAAPASACMIGPPGPAGPCSSPDLLTISSGATLAASQTGTITATDPNTGTTIKATYIEKVYHDPTNVYCANCLTWVLQVTNTSTSTDTIERVTISNFKGFLTDLGYVTTTGGGPGSAPGFPNTGTVIPNNVERNASGSVLGWDFNTTSSEINAGQTTVLLEAETNSTTVVPGTVTVQDGVAGSGPGLGPALPEIAFVPALGLIGGAVVGGFVFRRRRRLS